MALIDVKNVSKEFNGTKVLDRITFSIGEGDLLLLLGPNGAGKSTLLRCILGIMNFDGEIRVREFEVKTAGEESRRITGYLPQNPVLYEDMTCREIIKFYSEIRGLNISAEELLSLLESVGLSEKINVKVSELSGGMKQRLAIAITLMSNPSILILDEPLANLDFRGRSEFEEIIKRLRSAGKTVIMSVHALGGVSAYADKAVVLNQGKLIYDGAVGELLNLIKSKYKVYLKVEKNILNCCKDLDYEQVSEEWIRFSSDNLPKLLQELSRLSIPLENAIIEEPSIDEAVSKLIERGT